MKRIVICLSNDILYDRRMLRCAKTLSAEHEIHVLCRRIHPEEFKEINFSASRIKCFFNRGFLFYFELNLRLFIRLFQEHADYVLAVDYDTALAATLFSRIKKKMLIFDAHEYFEESIELVNRPLVKSFWKQLGRFTIPKAKLAYTVSESIATAYSEIHGIPFYCIRNVPEKSTKIKLSNEKKVIIYQGVLNQGRKLEILIDCAAYLNKDYEIWLLGEGDLAKKLKERASNINSKCKIIFHSWVQPDKLSEYTSQAYLAYNLLEQKSMSYYWSLANKFFDYLHAGVVSINSEFPEYVNINEEFNCCILANINTGQELAMFILDLDKNPEKFKMLEQNAAMAAEELCWERESMKLLDLFKNVDS